MAMRTCEICKKRKKDVVLRNTDQNECQQCYLTRGNTTNQQYQDQASETVTQVATQTDTPIPDEVSNQESTCTLVNEPTSPKRRLTPEFSAEQPSSPVYTGMILFRFLPVFRFFLHRKRSFLRSMQIR